ncbi:MAG: ThuA domain-containing protein [Melioribacteraceae bacterium]
MNKILIITAGHEFEPSFYKIFDSFEDIQYDTISQPKFNERIKDNITDKYNALIFYDMWQEINQAEKKAFIEMINRGKGIVFLHHSLVSYQHWDEFEKIIGGKYIEKDFYDDPNIQGSTYIEDIPMEIKVVDKNHPVTRGVNDFSINDEGYQNIKMSPGIHPLLSVSHPNCTAIIGWTNSYGKSNIVYILLGHGYQAYENENYRKLIYNSINWVAEIK